MDWVKNVLSMGADGCGLIFMGVVWSKVRGDRKTRQTEAQMIAQDMFGTLWPGKFSYKKLCADRHRGVRMGADG